MGSITNEDLMQKLNDMAWGEIDARFSVYMHLFVECTTKENDKHARVWAAWHNLLKELNADHL